MRVRSFTAADGTPLRADFYGDSLAVPTAGPDPAPRPGLVVLLHGYCEHRGRYRAVAQALTDSGYAVFCGDFRGHGESAGVRAYVERFTDYLDDVAAFIAEAQRAYAEQLPAGDPPLPYLVAHSMGAVVGLEYVLSQPRAVRALALTSPFLGLKLRVAAWKRGTAMLASLLRPTLAIPNGIDASAVSHDPAVRTAYATDPLITHQATARWFTEVLATHADLRERAGRIRTPILIMQAGDDRIVDPAATALLFARLGSRDKTLHDYPGLFHELFNEGAADRQRVLHDLTSWLATR
jgi:lysophospholipase